jgi:VanZ family protein
VGVGGLALLTIGSLMPAGDLPPIPIAGMDKLQHVLGHGALSAYATMLFAPARMRLVAALGLLLYGMGIEAAQAGWTSSREGDVADVVANAAGILLGQCVAFTRLSSLLVAIDRRWHA